MRRSLSSSSSYSYSKRGPRLVAFLRERVRGPLRWGRGRPV